jgi:glucose-6-phosphate 1-dehydrogenase
MEPPASLDPEAIREEKVKVLRSIPSRDPEGWKGRSLRGQYLAGRGPGGEGIPDYHAEAKVRPGSTTETFAAMRLEVDNWRFAGVPFILRTGKALGRQASEVRVRFKRPPEILFAGICRDRLPQNSIVIRIQPEEGIWLDFNAKEPGRASLSSNALRFSYRERRDDYFPEAYERLIADAMAGDATLFIRSDEAEEAWRIVDGLEASWSSPSAPPILRYAAGASPDLPELGL